MVEDAAFSHEIDYVPSFLRDSKSQRASKLLHCFKSYGDFGERGEFYLVVELHREGSDKHRL